MDSYNKKNVITAVTMMAVMFMITVLGGCFATSRQVDELKVELKSIKADNAETRELVQRMESMITESTEAGNRLRADISTSNDQLQEQIDAMLTNYNQLMVLIQELSQKSNTKYVIKSSPGTQTESTQQPAVNPPPATTTETPAETVQQPSIDCGGTYDESFILVRRGEYEKAIEGFELFLKECPNHESVENAHYWMAESYFAMEKYVDAQTKFEYFIENFKTSPNLSRAMYQLARSYQEMNKKADAKKWYQKVIDDFPGTFEANQASDRLKDLG